MADPVAFTITLDHVYRSRGKTANGGRLPGCAVCGESKYADVHMGRVPTMNAGLGMERRSYQNLKLAWERVLTAGIESTGLQRGLHSVMVECTLGFPTRAGRDEGNLRWMLEKALGDALVQGGWLEDDTFFPVARYQFGPLQGRLTPGSESVTIVLLPTTVDELEPFVDPGQLSIPIDDPA